MQCKYNYSKFWLICQNIHINLLICALIFENFTSIELHCNVEKRLTLFVTYKVYNVDILLFTQFFDLYRAQKYLKEAEEELSLVLAPRNPSLTS